MKELKYPEPIETEYGKVKAYLTEAEIMYIVESVKEADYLMREKIINLMLIKFATEYEITDDTDYDLYVASKFVSIVRGCVYDCLETIYGAIDEYNSLPKVVERAIEKLADKIPDEKGIKSIITHTAKKMEKLKGATK